MHFDPSVTVFALFSLFLILYPIGLAVWRRSLDGSLLDHEGAPLRRATVKLIDRSTSDVSPCRTDAQGRFHFDSLKTTADYEITVEHEGQQSRPIPLWKYPLQFELNLQVESLSPREQHREMPIVVLRERGTDPNWFGVA